MTPLRKVGTYLGAIDRLARDGGDLDAIRRECRLARAVAEKAEPQAAGRRAPNRERGR